MTSLLPNIPRLYTALAEWLACGVVLLPWPKRAWWQLRLFACGVGQLALQLWVGSWPLWLWVPGMLLNVGWMLMTLTWCATASATTRGFAVAKAFVFAEFAASVVWQVYCYTLWHRVANSTAWVPLVMLVGYALLFAGDVWLERRQMATQPVGRRALFAAVLTATIVFAVSNIGFILANTTFALGDSVTIFLFRTLVNLCGLLIFALQADQRQENQLQAELGAINRMFQTQYDQYTAYKESSTVIRRQFHDLKHQMAVILSEDNAAVRARYLSELSAAINTYAATISTGSAVLDTVLSQKNATALGKHIDLTCFADGQALGRMQPMDIASLFGNALDNAIEAVSQLEDPDQRLIEVRVAQKAGFLVITCRNVVKQAPAFRDGIPPTTKANAEQHGFGLKNIAYIVEKYTGQMTLKFEDGWFALKIAIPQSSVAP
ncbi:sensor histidine kinase [Lacticaseibacillus daqingensis]|uniref:sensor histidine kinase n=1 Tax=Lacticaseibacillus daqingensis TaxID=2486014 RepID=UPI000F785FDD|nr:sensor histidine kinase [Lacticaseibacillus daqingensis]